MSTMPEAMPAPRPVNRLLRTAVAAGVESAVQVHIARGDDLEWRDERGFTPLMIAASRNKAAICRMLIDAGVEPGATDHLGRNAITIAAAFGASEAQAAIESSISAKLQAIHELSASAPAPVFGDLLGVEQAFIPIEPVGESSASLEARVESVPPLVDVSGQLDEPACSQISTHERSRTVVVDLGDDIDLEFLSGWEAETESKPPPADLVLTSDATAMQAAISDHEPIDSSADWDDIDAFLPARAAALLRADNAESRERLRHILLRALREGSVPLSEIEDLSAIDGGPPDAETVSRLCMLINDLGAEADERFENRTEHGKFDFFVDSEETLEEDDEVRGALAAFDALVTPLNEPLRLYQLEYQRLPLLTAAAEVSVAQAMERGIEAALDALATWPAGIDTVLASARAVLSGSRDLRWMSLVPLRNEPQQFDDDPEVLAISTTAAVSSSEHYSSEHSTGEDADAVDESAAFASSVERLSSLSRALDPGAPAWRACRDALASLRLARSFLIGLPAAIRDDGSRTAADFAKAMAQYRLARDQMATSNLKLVVSIARKYLFSGMQLDDLIQEGNLGLMKAVDRYDWRRGYKFSTYATWWIRQQISRSIADKNRLIRVPVHTYEKMQRISQATRAFEASRGRDPSIEELAALVDMPDYKLLTLAATAQEPQSLDVIDDLDNLIAPHAKDDFLARDPMQIMEDRQLAESVHRFLGNLKAKPEHVLRMRFGIGIASSLTLEDIGKRLGVTRERVRQIEANAIRLLKGPAKLDVLLYELGESTMKPPPQLETTAEKTEGEGEGEGELVLPPREPVPHRMEPDSAGMRSAIDKVLAQARALGIDVQDERAKSGGIWVGRFDTHDTAFRRLTRKLIVLGFEFWPGKGYWK